MPIKQTTELDFIRALSQSPLFVELIFAKISGLTYHNTPQEYMDTFYTDFEDLEADSYDGFIVTGTPVEHLPFEDVRYWPQLAHIFDWTRSHVRASLYVCWGAQAGLYHHYGIPKYWIPEKRFGIFEQKVLKPSLPIFRGFDDHFMMPHSRHTEIRRSDIDQVDDLEIIVESAASGVSLVTAQGGRELFITGHLEYAPDTLNNEYHRDLKKGLPILPPVNYYPNDDSEQPPLVTWRAHARLFYTNWLHNYVRSTN